MTKNSSEEAKAQGARILGGSYADTFSESDSGCQGRKKCQTRKFGCQGRKWLSDLEIWLSGSEKAVRLGNLNVRV